MNLTPYFEAKKGKCMRAPGWLSQVKRRTLDVGTGRDLMVCGFELCVGLRADSTEPAWDSFSLPPCLSLPAWALSLSQNNK